MILKVARMGHPILRERALEVAPEQIVEPAFQKLIDDMIETMAEYDGAGLAAPQVHVAQRLVMFHLDSNPRYPQADPVPLTIAVNPVITPLTNELQGMWEGCLSVPGLRGYVERPARVRFEALDRYGQRMEEELEGFAAVVIQHECDHLDGRLFIDRITDTTRLAFQREFERYHLAPATVA